MRLPLRADLAPVQDVECPGTGEVIGTVAMSDASDVDAAVASLLLLPEQLVRASDVFSEMAAEMRQTSADRLQQLRQQAMTGANGPGSADGAYEKPFGERADLRLHRIVYAAGISVCALMTVLAPERVMAAFWWASEDGRIEGELCDELGYAILSFPLYVVVLPGIAAYYAALRRRAWAPSAQRSSTGSAGSRRHWLLVLAIDHGPWTVVGVGVWLALMVFVATAGVATAFFVCFALVIFSVVFLSCFGYF